MLWLKILAGVLLWVFLVIWIESFDITPDCEGVNKLDAVCDGYWYDKIDEIRGYGDD